MSEMQRKVVSSQQKKRSQPNTSRPKTATLKEHTKTPHKVTSSGGKGLKEKEAEFRKLNAELEEKTAMLVKEAEEIMRGGNVSPLHSDEKNCIRGTSELAVNSRDKQRVLSPARTASVESPKPSDDISLDIERTVRQLEKKLEEEEQLTVTSSKPHPPISSSHSNVVPEVAEELGSEAMIRFLKAKLRVLQEENEHITKEINHKEKGLTAAESKVKEVTEKNLRLEKNQHSIQLQISKYQKLSQDTQQKCDGLETQLISLKRELEAQKSTHRKASATQSAVEVRLNRALEEVDKYKSLYNNLKSDTKDSAKYDKSRIEELESENKVLERQKAELITAFKKQMKLIDVLKRQKVHLEAARMLAFTEEEFMKALDWEKS